jgi:hypothetical protein
MHGVVISWEREREERAKALTHRSRVWRIVVIVLFIKRGDRRSRAIASRERLTGRHPDEKLLTN